MIINMEVLSYFFTMMLMLMKKLLRSYSLGQKIIMTKNFWLNITLIHRLHKSVENVSWIHRVLAVFLGSLQVKRIKNTCIISWTVFPIANHTLKHHIQQPETRGRGRMPVVLTCISSKPMALTLEFPLSSLHPLPAIAMYNQSKHSALTSHFKIQREEDFLCG